MPFKPKNTKQISLNPKDAATLDGVHETRVAEFSRRNEMVVPGLRKEIRGLKKTLSKSTNPVRCAEARRKLKVAQRKLNDVVSEEKDYFLTNSPLVFEYFEKKQLVSEGKNSTTRLNGFFGIKSPDDADPTSNTVQRYLANVDESFISVGGGSASDGCSVCKEGELIPVEHEGILVCNKCYVCTPYLVENEKPSYKEPPKEVCVYAYKRINHFREILAQFQAKETTQIPECVLADVREQIRRERLTPQQVTNRKTKEMLKKLGHNKYYEHIPFIKDKLGIRPPVMSAELEETLCNLFMDIQAPYAKYCPENRVNFLNYYYTVYKLCELLDQTQFLPFFPMLKDRDKRIEQDEIWKQICGELDWEFIPTD